MGTSRRCQRTGARKDYGIARQEAGESVGKVRPRLTVAPSAARQTRARAGPDVGTAESGPAGGQ